MEKAVQRAAVESGQVSQAVWLLCGLATKWGDPLGLSRVITPVKPQKQDWEWFSSALASMPPGALDSSHNGCCVSSFVWYVGFIQQGMLWAVSLLHGSRTLFPTKRRLFYWTSMTVSQMYFVYIVDHSIISIHIAASENERLDHWWGMNIQQKRQRWRCGPAAEGREGHGKGNDETQGVYVGLTNTKSDLSSCFFVPRQYIKHEIEILLLLCWVAWWQLLHGSKPSEKQEDGGNA